MKIRAKERIAILGKFTKDIEELSIKGIAEAINYGEYAFAGSQENEIYDVRESLLDIEFNELGFRELMEYIEENSKGIKLEFKHPIFLVKLKDNKIHNLFTDLGRLKFYGFKSNMSKDQLKDYVVVEALNYLLPDRTEQKLPEFDQDVLFKYLDKIPGLLNEGNISLINKESSMLELAKMLANKTLTEEDILRGNFK